MLSPQLDVILRKARDRAYALRSLTLALQLERGVSHVLQVCPATPTENRDLLLKLLNLELQAHPPQSGIVAVTLEAEATQPQTAQRGLFQAQFPEPDKLEPLLARLRSIAGEGNVGSPRLLNTHREDAFTLAPFLPSVRGTAEDEHVPSRLTLRLFRPPQATRVTCWADRPRMLFWQGAKLSITDAAGPWHAGNSWWNGEVWNHDSWDVVTAAPIQALRLRQEHVSKDWFVVGLND